ncbi:hypothetical protein C8F04DRAFT_1197019 [Mycena alexandri]|uniref:Uncharacterized protein n=1 Tax=Mycena alexandri TaxID=1745969 RepID=A0AAD6S563_9AGAR|nr:hypothetical protein C8F04DRAFT_1197019 [Mycena alexandri]
MALRCRLRWLCAGSIRGWNKARAVSAGARMASFRHNVFIANLQEMRVNSSVKFRRIRITLSPSPAGPNTGRIGLSMFLTRTICTDPAGGRFGKQREDGCGLRPQRRGRTGSTIDVLMGSSIDKGNPLIGSSVDKGDVSVGSITDKGDAHQARRRVRVPAKAMHGPDKGNARTRSSPDNGDVGMGFSIDKGAVRMGSSVDKGDASVGSTSRTRRNGVAASGLVGDVGVTLGPPLCDARRVGARPLCDARRVSAHPQRKGGEAFATCHTRVRRMCAGLSPLNALKDDAVSLDAQFEDPSSYASLNNHFEIPPDYATDDGLYRSVSAPPLPPQLHSQSSTPDSLPDLMSVYHAPGDYHTITSPVPPPVSPISNSRISTPASLPDLISIYSQSSSEVSLPDIAYFTDHSSSEDVSSSPQCRGAGRVILGEGKAALVRLTDGMFKKLEQRTASHPELAEVMSDLRDHLSRLQGKCALYATDEVETGSAVSLPYLDREDSIEIKSLIQIKVLFLKQKIADGRTVTAVLGASALYEEEGSFYSTRNHLFAIFVAGCAYETDISPPSIALWEKHNAKSLHESSYMQFPSLEESPQQKLRQNSRYKRRKRHDGGAESQSEAVSEAQHETLLEDDDFEDLDEDSADGDFLDADLARAFTIQERSVWGSSGEALARSDTDVVADGSDSFADTILQGIGGTSEDDIAAWIGAINNFDPTAVPLGIGIGNEHMVEIQTILLACVFGSVMVSLAQNFATPRSDGCKAEIPRQTPGRGARPAGISEYDRNTAEECASRRVISGCDPKMRDRRGMANGDKAEHNNNKGMKIGIVGGFEPGPQKYPDAGWSLTDYLADTSDSSVAWLPKLTKDFDDLEYARLYPGTQPAEYQVPIDMSFGMLGPAPNELGLNHFSGTVEDAFRPNNDLAESAYAGESMFFEQMMNVSGSASNAYTAHATGGWDSYGLYDGDPETSKGQIEKLSASEIDPELLVLFG